MNLGKTMFGKLSWLHLQLYFSSPPIYEMVWNHYHNMKGIADFSPSDPVYYTKAKAAALRPEGISTDHQPFTTLLYTKGPVISGDCGLTGRSVHSFRRQSHY
ncbi:hypothetical protein [Paenibacillus sp. Soil787]|uniref:hypothetical protein n=1 Tax=Paenibacillus sp. Soil787 TaxID=1736411 RepID=UPI0006F4B6A8|nr:hypothetical protein [Paenibacillus sp. Soil787]KRF42266.1 hypothetical protein ASG93_21465 [Paenibacillus sp. Soil787]